MARTLAQLRTLLGQLAALDPYDNMAGESPASSDYNEQLNWAYRIICKRANLWDPAMTLTLVADQATYSKRDTDGTVGAFSRRIIDLHAVYINGNPLYMRNERVPGLWSFEELEHVYPDWRATAAAVPFLVLEESHSTARLYPKPTQAVVDAGNNYAAGTYMPAALSADGDYPDLPEEFHEAIAYLAHVIAHKPTATESEQWKRLGEYQSEAVQMLEVLADENKRRMQVWGTVIQSNIPDYMEI